MLNDTTLQDIGGRARVPEVMMSVTGTDSSSTALTAVVICMTIMAICAVLYFAIRYYFEERRWRAGATMCKCLPPGAAANLNTIECANTCRYNEKRAVNVGVQTAEPSAPWPHADVRVSDAKLAGRKFASPANNNEAVPHWRPPATGSSQRYAGSGGAPYHHGRTSQKKRYYVHHSTQYPSEHSYPLRRSRNISMMPSVLVQSASSSDSYSHLTMSHASKSAPPVNEDEDDRRMLHPQTSGLTDDKLNGSNPFHPRYNTPVSQSVTNDEDLTAVVVNAALPVVSAGSQSSCSPVDEAGYEQDVSGTSEASSVPVTDVGTQVCPAIESTSPVRACQALGRVASAAPCETVYLGKLRNVSSVEVLSGGRFVSRWTQTDAASVMSLDWDHFDERIRGSVEVGVDAAVNTDVDMITDAGTEVGDVDRLHFDDENESAAAGTSSATLLMVSHTSGETSLLPPRHNSRASSPYVLCFNCNDEYGFEDRRQSVTNVNGVTTINIGHDFDKRRSPVRCEGRPPSAPPPHPLGTSFHLGPTPPERQRRPQGGSRTLPRPSRP